MPIKHNKYATDSLGFDENDDVYVFDDINKAVNFAYTTSYGWDERCFLNNIDYFCCEVAKVHDEVEDEDGNKTQLRVSYSVFNFGTKAAIFINKEMADGSQTKSFMTKEQHKKLSDWYEMAVAD